MSTPRNMGTRKRKRAQTVTDNTIKEDHKELIAALVPEVTKGVVSALQAMGVLGKNPNSSNPEVHQVEAVAETSSTSSATDNHSMPNNSADSTIPSQIFPQQPGEMQLQRGQLQDLQSISSDLIQQYLAPSTHTTYQRAIDYYHRFVSSFALPRERIPVQAEDIILFIALCFSQGLACSTVTTYVSALSFQHKIRNMADPTQNFIVKKCLQGYRNRTGIVNSRLPITPYILKQLIASLQYTASSYFVRVLMKSMYLLAFHCFLRIGEFTASKDKNCHLLSVQSVCLLKSNQTVQ